MCVLTMDKSVMIIVAVTILGQTTGRAYRSHIKCDGEHDHAGFHHPGHPEFQNWHHGSPDWHYPHTSNQDRRKDENHYYFHHFPHENLEKPYWHQPPYPGMWNNDRWDNPSHLNNNRPWKVRDTQTTASPVATSTSSARVQQCIKSCPVTSEYNPVCGTNDMTYTNLGRLECAKYCGVDVQVKRMSPCAIAVTTNSPVNNIPSWTTPTTSRPLFTSPTVVPLKITSEPPSQPESTPTPSITIASDLLDSIFSTPEEDPNYDIDVRTRHIR